MKRYDELPDVSAEWAAYSLRCAESSAARDAKIAAAWTGDRSNLGAGIASAHAEWGRSHLASWRQYAADWQKVSGR